MNITLPLKLAPDLLIMPASALDSATLSKCECPIGHFVVSRPNSRKSSSVVNESVARLLNRFSKATTIVEAALHECMYYGGTPELALEKVYAILRPFIRAGWIICADEVDQAVSGPFRTGDLIDSYRVQQMVSRLDDTEIYLVRTPSGELAALKIATSNFAREMTTVLAHEATLLRRLSGICTPGLIGSGTVDRRSYIVSTWTDGDWVNVAADNLRAKYRSAAIPELLALCCRIAQVYSRLHAAGILHGDVSPKNLLVGASGEVTLIDLGLGRDIASDAKATRRGGVPEYYEPELAACLLESEETITASPEGEQYALAVLFYRVLSGASYLRLSSIRSVALRQIVSDPPLSFSEHGLAPFPTLENILRRALSKDPERRYPSVAKFAADLVALRDEQACALELQQPSPARTSVVVPELKIDPAYVLGDKAAFSSVAYGAAGIALALYIMSANGSGTHALGEAQAWIRRAQIWAKLDGAFSSAALGIGPEQANPGSVWHGLAGVYLVEALIAISVGDCSARNDAWRHYAAICGAEEVATDITNGLAGQLLGCAWLLHAAGNHAEISAEIRQLGDGIQRKLLCCHAHSPAASGNFLGVAHGIAGQLYATLIWSEVAAGTVPSQVVESLHWLADQAGKLGRRIQFPMRYNQQGSNLESWCHGSPGFVHLFAAAHRKLGGDFWLELLEGCAWGTWYSSGRHGGSLCCGDAGRAYALLSAWRSTGDSVWRERAQTLARQAMVLNQETRFYSLYKGKLGAEVLASDMNDTARASMPLFELDRR
jgi:serine/threonine-protein kinase